MDLDLKKAFLLQNNKSGLFGNHCKHMYIRLVFREDSSVILQQSVFCNVINMVLLVVVNKIAKKVSDVSLW